MKDFTIEDIKALCQEVKLPLGIPFIDERLKEYEEKYSGAYPYYAMLAAVTKALEPSVAVELGSWQGTSAACLASGYKGCEVITIDHHSDPGDGENKARTLEACTKYPNLTYLQGTTCDMVHAQKPGAMNAYPSFIQLLGSRKIDVLFIDSWHGGEYAKADWDAYSPYLSKGALVICDDIYGGDCATIFGMMDFWKELPGEKHLSTNLHGGYPMGFVKVA